jgi:hypothetical protein
MLAAHVTCRTHSDTVSRNVETGDTNGNGRETFGTNAKDGTTMGLRVIDTATTL